MDIATVKGYFSQGKYFRMQKANFEIHLLAFNKREAC